MVVVAEAAGKLDAHHDQGSNGTIDHAHLQMTCRDGAGDLGERIEGIENQDDFDFFGCQIQSVFVRQVAFGNFDLESDFDLLHHGDDFERCFDYWLSDEIDRS